MLKELKHSFLTWLGIFGGAITLLSNLQDIIELAKWVDWVVIKWRELFIPIISGLIGAVGIRMSAGATSMLAMAIFVSCIALGARLENSFKGTDKEIRPVALSNIFNINVLLAVSLYILQAVLVIIIIQFPYALNIAIRFPYFVLFIDLLLYCTAIVIGLRGWPIRTSLIVAVSMVCFSYIFGYAAHETAQPNVSETASTIIGASGAIICGLIVVGVAPPLAFTKRVIFMMVGVACIVALSQLGHLAT